MIKVIKKLIAPKLITRLVYEDELQLIKRNQLAEIEEVKMVHKSPINELQLYEIYFKKKYQETMDIAFNPHLREEDRKGIPFVKRRSTTLVVGKDDIEENLR